MESLVTPTADMFCFICSNKVSMEAYGLLSELNELSTNLVSSRDFICIATGGKPLMEQVSTDHTLGQFETTSVQVSTKPDYETFTQKVLKCKSGSDDCAYVKAIQNLPLCDPCADVITTATNKKVEIDTLKMKINAVKQQLRESIDSLESHLKSYSIHMQKMEQSVKLCDLEKVKSSVSMLQGNTEEKLKEIETVRSLILRASQDLNEMGIRDHLTRKSKRLKRKRELESRVPVLDELSEQNKGNEQETQCHLLDSMQQSIPDFLMGTLIKEEPLDDETFRITSEDMGDLLSTHLLEETDGFEPEIIEEVMKEGALDDRNKNFHQQTIADDIQDLIDTSDDDFMLDDEEEILESDSETTSQSEEEDAPLQSNQAKTSLGKKSKEGRLKRGPDPNSNRSRKASYTNMLSRIDFGRMSKLKRKLVERILHKKFRRPQRRPKTPGKEHVEDPRQSHFLEYEPSSDTLNLDGITINIHESKNTDMEDVLSLSCSLCGYMATPTHNSRHPVDSFIYNHIAGQHLNLFQCVQCGSNLGGFKQYSDHIVGHRMGFACDICGRPLGGAQALARHKWSHLNELEAAELVAKGLKDPREKKESSKLYPCATCGKIFPQRCQLKKHEKVHAEVRERITCEICGKLFLPSGFISHKRYYCFPEGAEQPRISCPLCPKVFKNKQFMQVHMDRAHKTERNHKCPQCGKGFKTKKDLMTHEETHTTERAFSCKKGCGRSYKTRKNCNAHEKRCDGRGGVLIQRFLDAGEDRPFTCRKGCGRAYKTRRTLRGHEKNCTGLSFVGEGGGIGGEERILVEEIQVQEPHGLSMTTMTVLGAALQASMEAVMEGSVLQAGVVIEGEITVPEAVVTETVISKPGDFG